jgi:hypothetical protein
MATKYMYSGAGGAGTGADWTNAYTTMALAIAGLSAGDTLYVAHDHSESTASALTFTFPGTAASPLRIICVNRAGSVPPVSADLTTGALVANSGSNNMNLRGYVYHQGMTYQASSTSAQALNILDSGAGWMKFVNCTLKLGTTDPGGRIAPGILSTSPAQKIELVNTKLHFQHASQGLRLMNGMVWRDTSSPFPGSTPTTLCYPWASIPFGTFLIEGVDLSAMASGCSILDVSQTHWGEVLLRDCKLGSSVAMTTGTFVGQGGLSVKLANSDSANTNYRYHFQNYLGTITSETTIVKSSTISTDGTTPLTWKMVSTANAKFICPLESEWMAVWVDSTGSKTVTVSIVTDNVTLTDAECWVEARYQGTASFPLALFANDRSADILAAGANQTTESPTWTTTGLTTPVKQKLNVTFTTTGKGLIWVRVCLAKASTTVYVDAAPVIT